MKYIKLKTKHNSVGSSIVDKNTYKILKLQTKFSIQEKHYLLLIIMNKTVIKYKSNMTIVISSQYQVPLLVERLKQR